MTLHPDAELDIDALWEVIWDSLVAQSEGVEYDEEETGEAAEILAVLSLVETGFDLDKIIDALEQREHEIRVKWDPAEGDLSLTIEWLDGEGIS